MRAKDLEDVKELVQQLTSGGGSLMVEASIEQGGGARVRTVQENIHPLAAGYLLSQALLSLVNDESEYKEAILSASIDSFKDAIEGKEHSQRCHACRG